MKSPLYFWLHRTKVRWRFRKILWPSQNIWALLVIDRSDLECQVISNVDNLFWLAKKMLNTKLVFVHWTVNRKNETNVIKNCSKEICFIKLDRDMPTQPILSKVMRVRNFPFCYPIFLPELAFLHDYIWCFAYNPEG